MNVPNVYTNDADLSIIRLKDLHIFHKKV